jgi:hypothetical protein
MLAIKGMFEVEKFDARTCYEPQITYCFKSEILVINIENKQLNP